MRRRRLIGSPAGIASVLLLGLASQSLAEPYAGYTFFGQNNGRASYLCDMNNRAVHTWNHNRSGGYSAYLLENGHVLRTANADRVQLNGGGAQGCVQEIDWNGNVVWEYTYSSATYVSHHDIEPMPNGNVLMIAWEVKTAAEATAAGRSRNAVIWPDHIIEVEPNGQNGGNIVWQWHAWDHLIQDYNANRANYGVVGDHPELLDVNLGAGGGMGGGDWMHINGISYNPDLDQIVISSHELDEIYIIDHSTTTAEAASHAGGNSGMGGDFLYRWGKPANYDAPGNAVFSVCHCSWWIPAGLPGAGNILVFNNREGQGTSMVVELNLPLNDQGTYDLGDNGAYGPANPAWSYTANGFYSNHLGGCQRLPNGNTLIVESTSGYLFEVSANGNVEWSYNYGREVARGLRYGVNYPGVYELHPVENGDVVVNEILADNSSTIVDQDNEYDGWIELYNNTNDDVSLWGFHLTNNANALSKWTFPDTTLPAGEYLIVWMDNDLAQEGLHANFELTPAGSRVILTAPNEEILDNIQYGAQDSDISYGRFPNGTGNFIPMSPSYEAANNNGVEIPEITLSINELFAFNRTVLRDQNREFDPCIEIFNSGGAAVSLLGCYLSNSSENLALWAFPDTSINQGAMIVVWLDGDAGQTGLHTDFTITSAAGAVYLSESASSVLDSLRYNVQTVDISIGRYPDGPEGAFRSMTPTIGSANREGIINPDCPVKINECLVRNSTKGADQNGEFDSWIELFNPSDEMISLFGFYLTNDSQVPLKWAFPDTSIAAGGYLIVWMDNETEENGLHAGFEMVAVGGSAALSSPPSFIIDNAEFGEQTTDISFGRFPDGSGGFILMTPTFGFANYNGILENSGEKYLPQSQYLLLPNHPNPFNSSTFIAFNLPSASEIRLAIYDQQGRLVNELVRGWRLAGFHEVVWNGTDKNGLPVNSGIYLCHWQANGQIHVQKLVLLR